MDEEISEILEKGGALLKEFEFSAKDYFRNMTRSYDLGFDLSAKFPEVACLICVTHLESLAKLKYTKEKYAGKRFKKFVQKYANQSDEFNQNYLDWLWDFYRCNLVHECVVPAPFFENKEKEEFGVIKLYRLPEELKKNWKDLEIKYIKTKKILEITKTCLINLEKEFDPTDNSKIIHRISLKEKVKKDKIEEELEYVR